jgi:hypothetical protein
VIGKPCHKIDSKTTHYLADSRNIVMAYLKEE